MILDVYDNSLQKIGKIYGTTFVTYTKPHRGVGTFEIKCTKTKEMLSLLSIVPSTPLRVNLPFDGTTLKYVFLDTCMVSLDKTNIIEVPIFGKIVSFEKDDDEIVVRGRLIEGILEERLLHNDISNTNRDVAIGPIRTPRVYCLKRIIDEAFVSLRASTGSDRLPYDYYQIYNEVNNIAYSLPPFYRGIKSQEKIVRPVASITEVAGEDITDTNILFTEVLHIPTDSYLEGFVTQKYSNGTNCFNAMNDFLANTEYGFTFTVNSKGKIGAESTPERFRIDKGGFLPVLAFLEPIHREYNNTLGNIPIIISAKERNAQKIRYAIDYSDAVTAVLSLSTQENSYTQEFGAYRVDGFDSFDMSLKSNGRLPISLIERDLTSELAPESYTTVATQDGLTFARKLYERLMQYNLQESITCEFIPTENTKFNEDFFLGDFVTVIDDDFDLMSNVQLTAYTKSLDQTGEHVDFTFGSPYVLVREQLRRKGVL